MTYTIENETNRIQAHATAKKAAAVPNADRFGSQTELGKLASNWQAARLIEIWNSLGDQAQITSLQAGNRSAGA